MGPRDTQGAVMRGSIVKRCGCTEVVDGRRRQLGARCPKLRRRDGSWNPKHGTWGFSVSLPGPDGRPKMVRRYGFATAAEAQAALDELKERARRGVTATDITVADWLQQWLTRKRDITASTHRSYATHVRNHIAPVIGRIQLADLRVTHVSEMLAEVPGSDATRQRVRATLRSALADAVREGLVPSNPAALVKIPSGRRPRALVWTEERVRQWRETGERPSPVMVWTPAQLGQFLDHAQDDRLYALWHLIAHRGLRRGEACGLEWGDIDFEARTLTVRRQLVQVGWEVVEAPPKSDAGNRTIALDTGSVEALRAHRRRQLEERMLLGEAWTDSGKVFTREDGVPLHPASVSDRFRRLVDEAGLPPVRLHDLRHGAASLMLAAGVPMKVVQETLGHSSSALTADTYTSVYPEVAAEAAEAAAALVPRRSRTGVD